MASEFRNVYADERRAEAYSGLEFPATYYLAFRDLPKIIAEHVSGRRALDFGCGAGRSTRFLRRLGFEVTGVDISTSMIRRARREDPGGDYRLVPEGTLADLHGETFDLVLSAFTFDNVPMADKVSLFEGFRRHLGDRGRIVNLVSAPEIYVHEWASFSTRDFPENREASTGDVVRIVMLDVEDRRPVEDVYCSDAAYGDIYRRAELELLETHRPLGRSDEPHDWVTEIEVSPWIIHVTGPADAGRVDPPPRSRVS